MDYCRKKTRNERKVNKKASHEPVCGKKDTTNNFLKLNAINTVRSWHCKVSRISEGLSSDDVLSNIVEQGVTPIEIHALPRKDNVPTAMYTAVPYDAKDRVVQSLFWLCGI